MCLTIYHLLRRCLWILPVFTVTWVVCTFGITFGMAVGLNHTQAAIPYISKTGTEVPERGVFTLFVVIAAFAMAMNAEIRYHYVQLVMSQLSLTPHEKNRWMTANILSLYLSLIAALGLLLVASFQVNMLNVPHYLGAFCTFCFGLICCWINSAITYKLYKEERKREYLYTFVWQIVNSVIITVLFLLFYGAFGSYTHQKDAGHGTKLDSLKSIFLVSAVSEWFLAVSIVAFVLSFIPGFKKMEFDGLNVKWRAPGSGKSICCCFFPECCS